MNKLKYKILALLNKRLKYPNNWDSIHSYQDFTTLYACKNCYEVIDGGPGYIEKANKHICHSLNIPMSGYVSERQIFENRREWEIMKAKCEEED